MSASKELHAICEDWNWNKIGSFGEQHHLQWIFNKSADAPWQNGCSEALIKSVKRCLVQCIGTNQLTFSELQTVCFNTANTLNERPIGMKTTDANDGSYLCPNDLLLGRTGNSAPIGQFAECSSKRRRAASVNELIAAFKKKWLKYYFPTLIVWKKWHTECRNLQVGDIVLVQPEKGELMGGKWRLAQVCVANEGRDGAVRDVTLRYKQQRENKKYEGIQDTEIKRSVHRLVLLLPIEEQCR